jgi:hypothetical protein
MSMSHSSERRRPDRKILLIRMNHSYAGFFSYVTFALNQLRYAEAMGLHPVVYFGPRSGDGPNAFHDPRLGDNSWDYFFEPVASLAWPDLRARLADPRDPLTTRDVVQLDADFLWYLHAYDPDGIYNYPYGHYKSLTDDRLDAWYARQRASARRLLARHVRPKPHILAKVDEFWQGELAGHDVLGVHMRGSDKGAADASARLSRIVEPEEYFPHIDRFLGETANPRIFLATEQSQFVARTRARYGKRVVARAVTRTNSFGAVSNPFQARTGSGYLKGEEVLVDCLLLSRSQRLLRCTSAVGEYAVYFNEGLESLNLNHPPSPAAAPAAVPPFRSFVGPGRLFEGVVLINLDSRPDRLQRSLGELARQGVGDCVTRLSAVRHDNGLFGCSVSHLEAVRHARRQGWQSVLILEDDIRFAAGFAHEAPPALHDLAARDWGIFQFGAMIEPCYVQTVSPHLFRFWRGHAAHAVALHARTYDFLIGDYICELDRGNWDQRMHVPFDEYLNNRLACFFPAYGSRKLLISQHSGRSDTWGHEVDYRSLIERSYDLLPAA